MLKSLKMAFCKVEDFKLEKNLKDTEVAEMVGLPKATYSKIKNGVYSLTLDHIEKISASFGIPIYELFVNDEVLQGYALSTTLNKLIEAEEYSIEELAQRTEIKISRIEEILKGYWPSTEEIQILSNALGITKFDLYTPILANILEELSLNENNVKSIINYIEETLQ